MFCRAVLLYSTAPLGSTPHFTSSHCFTLHCTALRCNAQYWTVLHYFSVLDCSARELIAQRCTALFSSVTFCCRDFVTIHQSWKLLFASCISASEWCKFPSISSITQNIGFPSSKVYLYTRHLFRTDHRRKKTLDHRRSLCIGGSAGLSPISTPSACHRRGLAPLHCSPPGAGAPHPPQKAADINLAPCGFSG